MSYAQLADAVGGKLFDNRQAEAMFNGAGIDSRVVKDKQLFIAIRGEKYDGHNYIKDALNSGASGLLIESSFTEIEKIPSGTPIVRVENSHQAMMKLATVYRNKLNAKFVAITGSNGKTTTKELTYQLIKNVENNTFCSPGNYNNLFGVPLALFAISQNTKVAVMELGISTKDEMPRLAEIVQPDLVLFTNVGPSHLEFLTSVTDVAGAKLKLLEKVSPEVPALINIDDDVLMAEAKKIRSDLITFGIDKKADFTIDAIELDKDGNSLITIDGHEFILPLFGKHQAYNLLAAYAVFKTLGYSFNNINTRKISLNSAPMRGQIIERAGIKFISDCYNANPDSVKSGLLSFSEFKTENRRVLILGDMLELGKESKKYHQEIGSILSKQDFDLLITVGEMAKYFTENFVLENNIHYDNSSDAAEEIKKHLQVGDFVYLKASRGVGLETILNQFANNEETN